MSKPYRRTIAKEIVDQTLDHLKKRKENAINNQSEQKSRYKPPVKQPENKYKPSADFYNIFSTIVGNSETNKNVVKKPLSKKVNQSTENDISLNKFDSQKIPQEAIKENETKHLQGSSVKSDSSQKLEETVELGQGEDSIDTTANPSVFERLSREAKRKKGTR